MEIQECLTHGMTFKDIGRKFKKDQATICKELKRMPNSIPKLLAELPHMIEIF